ncbi:ArsR/SmtB family transcription factor [Pseudaestuariivita atlantica]|uniref:HTH arsR-type domain-containing protein n=1 Tax=Pseudaestuariivita atlantica TaxID=1317121 RepID=A0A0L1JNZ4_9RHOB|nr:metalloregulator ArsR/SmtB family transcription factor [Pseudaestuariivita atlantica]KNG93479.1 hypothetical protein ATO11_09620 [Pseudaestuariivita atlantica]
MPYEDQFAALGHPIRQTILRELAQGPANVRHLTEVAGTSQPVVSQHLKVLRDAGLVSVEEQGTRRVYGVEAEGLEVLLTYLETQWLQVIEGAVAAGEEDRDA